MHATSATWTDDANLLYLAELLVGRVLLLSRDDVLYDDGYAVEFVADVVA